MTKRTLSKSSRTAALACVSLLIAGIWLPGCSDSSDDTERPPTSDAAGSFDSAGFGDMSGGNATDAGSDADADADDSDGGGIVSTTSKSAFCDEIGDAIRATSGAVINVAPAGEGRVTVDGQEMSLRQAVSSASEGDTVLLADGTYTFPTNGDGAFTGVYITTPNVTLRSQSGDPESVVIDSNYREHGNGSAPITIAAAGVTIADVTVNRSIYHLVHIWEDGDGAALHNLRLTDGGQQFVKSSGGSGTIDDVHITCSRFEMSDTGRDNVWGYGAQDGNTTCYTGGIDSHEGKGWTITDNAFRGIYCDATGVQRPAHGMNPDQRDGQTYQGGLAEHAIHMWDSPAGGDGHFIARNQIIDCARGIGLGFRAEVHDVVVRDNMIFSSFPASREHDVGISAERAQNTDILHNTVFYSHADAYPNPIEYRWESTSGLRVMNNLTGGTIRARDGAQASVESNVTNAEASWFADAAAGDLRLANCEISDVVGAGSDVGQQAPDFDHDERGDSVDIGADQCVDP